MPWYQFTPAGSPRNPADPNSYTLVGSTPPSCPNPNNFTCAIQANDNSGQPIITAALQVELLIALENRTESTNVLLKPTA